MHKQTVGCNQCYTKKIKTLKVKSNGIFFTFLHFLYCLMYNLPELLFLSFHTFGTYLARNWGSHTVSHAEEMTTFSILRYLCSGFHPKDTHSSGVHCRPVYYLYTYYCGKRMCLLHKGLKMRERINDIKLANHSDLLYKHI